MSTIKEYVEGLELSVGDSKRIDCPSCRGNKTFSVTNNMGSLIWNCYKAGCDVSGGTRVHLSAADIRKTLAPTATQDIIFDKPEWLVYNSVPIADFGDRWRLDTVALGLLYDVKDDRVVFPIERDGTALMIDAVGRSLNNRMPKWRRYGAGAYPYTSGVGTVAVVVEDCISAAAVGEYEGIVGVALLGTSLSLAHRNYLSKYDRAIIALDPDALPKTIQIAKELRGHVKDVQVLRIYDDLKYRITADIDKLLSVANMKGIT